MIIDRQNSQRGIGPQIDILAGEFQKVGNSEEFPEGWNQFPDGDGYVLSGDGNMDRLHSKMSDRCDEEKEERPKKKSREKAKPLEVELDRSGEFPRGKYVAGKSRKWKRGAFGLDGQF